MQEKNPIQVSERIFRIIEFLANEGPTGLSELSEQLGLNKSTVHRILNSLICMDYAKQDPETLKYGLSFKFCRISDQVLAHNDMIGLAKPHLRRLSDLTGETIHLVQIDGVNAVYIDKVENSLNSIRLVSKVGKSIPLYCSGVGKALLADRTDETIRQIWQQSDIQKLTDNTITDLELFMKTINRIRATGYAMDNEENELGVRCIAVSLKNHLGKSSYAISISAPKERMTDDRITALTSDILLTKSDIQQAIGNNDVL
jgi:DNA-binding IclR family transcriptional regulator